MCKVNDNSTGDCGSRHLSITTVTNTVVYYLAYMSACSLLKRFLVGVYTRPDTRPLPLPRRPHVAAQLAGAAQNNRDNDP